MRIYFVGAQSCGKTTLAKYVSHTYHLPLLTEVARIVLAEKEATLESLRSNIEEIDNFQREVFVRQVQEEQKHKSFVSDRSFDNLAYAATHSRIFKDIVNSDLAKDYISRLLEPDVLVFFIRPSSETMKEDGVREKIDWDGVVRIDAQVKLLLELFGIPYIQISTSSMQERVRLVDVAISLYKKSNKDTLRRGSCVLTFNAEGKVLAVSRKNDKNDYGLPGGKVEADETHGQAAIRELKEETGLDMTNPCQVFSIDDGLGYYAVVYIGDVSGTIHTSDNEGQVSWVYPKVLTENCSFASYNTKLFNSIGIPIQAIKTIPKTAEERKVFAGIICSWWESFEAGLDEH
jgi:8-oxo-dGTP pyrophosphatase MutT (NUDIX family)